MLASTIGASARVVVASRARTRTTKRTLGLGQLPRQRRFERTARVDARATAGDDGGSAFVGCARVAPRARTGAERRRGDATTVRSTAVARASDDAAPPSTFLLGIAWFFAHQLIGVGNDVIMKFTGQNLGVAQVVFLRCLLYTSPSPRD